MFTRALNFKVRHSAFIRLPLQNDSPDANCIDEHWKGANQWTLDRERLGSIPVICLCGLGISSYVMLFLQECFNVNVNQFLSLIRPPNQTVSGFFQSLFSDDRRGLAVCSLPG